MTTVSEDANAKTGSDDGASAQNRYTQAVLERHKREGLVLAVKARWIALAIVAVMLPFLNPRPEVLYYEVLLALLALNGWFQFRFGKVGLSRIELLLMGIDVVLMTAALTVPNPWDQDNWPAPMIYEFQNFQYFFIILAAGTLTYSWRTIIALGNWTVASWLIAAVAIWYFATPDAELAALTAAAFGHDSRLLGLFDPNSVKFDLRLQEIVVFLIVSHTLALTVWRFNKLLLDNAALERERTNLSRYFSPRVVEALSQNDEPLKVIREHEVAVLFVDIAGFTTFAAERAPTEVITTLRRFHAIIEAQVFANDGTLDKFLGDGVMATFGTPVAGPHDASNALVCMHKILDDVKAWNAERGEQGESAIDVRFGVHFGPVVLGDIGATQMEFATIGNTVNVASRLEALTRSLQSKAALSEDMRKRVMAETGDETGLLAGFVKNDGQNIRGLNDAVTIWALRN